MQFGRALHRLLYQIFTAPKEHGPVYLLKIDMSDGFYRIRVKPDNVLKLGVVFPTDPGEPPLIAFPITLPMGWSESPAYFCSATETIADLTNQYAGNTWDPPVHRLEALALTLPTDAPVPGKPAVYVPAHLTPVDATATPPHLSLRQHRISSRLCPLAYADVFVDDEILAAQGTQARLNRFRRQMLHINDMGFRPNTQEDQVMHRKEPISEKKLQKVDACWSTQKQILGWTIDTIQQTLELPPHRKE